MKKTTSLFRMAVLALAYASTGHAATGVCQAQGNYLTTFIADWTEQQNASGSSWTIPASATGSSYQIACDCSPGTKVNLYYSTTSALTAAGYLSGFYRLNEHLDIKTEINAIPGAGALPVPTPVGSPVKDTSGSYSINTANSVCQDDPADKRLSAVSSGSNTTFTLYVSKPFLGEMDIPDTLIAYLQAAWSSSSGYPKKLSNIAELHIQGRITVPQNCKINQGDVIQVNLGDISAAQFTMRDQMPEGYTPVSFDITYDCGATSGMKNSVYMFIEGADLASQYVLVARRREGDNVPDVGIRLVDVTSTQVDIPFNPGSILMDKSGHGSAHLLAYPVNLTGGVLAPGRFKGTATITVVVK